MNDILQDIETAELHTYNTIKIITSLQDTITKLGKDDDTSDIEFSQFEKEAKYLKKLAQKIANDLTPPVPNSSSISFATKFNKTTSKSNAIDSCPKFIKAKPKKMMREKSQQTCERKLSKAHQDGLRSKHESMITTHHHKRHKLKKQVEPVQIGPKTISNITFQKEPPLQPTKYLQHILIPIGKVNLKNISTQSMPSKWEHEGPNFIYKKCSEGPNQKAHLKQVVKRTSGVEHFTKLMQLCMNVKEERESDLEKQIYNLEEEMAAVMESNKSLYNALEKLEEQNATTILLKDSSTNTLTDITVSSKADPLPELPLDKPPYPTSEQITNELAEDIIKCIHGDIQEITSNITKTKSQNKLLFKEQEKIGKPKYELGKHVSFLENAIASMQNKLETAQNKQVELAIQSKAVVEAAHRMTNEPWTY